MNEIAKQTSIPTSAENLNRISIKVSPESFAVATSHMTDSMNRYGQAVSMGPENLGRNVAPSVTGPPPPPPSSALSPFQPFAQGYVYSVDAVSRSPLAPFPGQAYRSPYPAFPGQYSEPYDQYLTGPIPPEYSLNVRYTNSSSNAVGGDKVSVGGGGGGVGVGAAVIENNGMAFAGVQENRGGGSALPPFSSIAAAHPSSGRGSTPGIKEDMGEFGEGLGARLSRGSASTTPTPGQGGGGGEYGESLSARLIERGMSREDSYNSSPTNVQYRPWEVGSAHRGDPSSSSQTSPTSPSSSYSFAEGFLKFQPSSGNASEKGGVNNGQAGGGGGANANNSSGGNNHHHAPGNNGTGNGQRAEASSPSANVNSDEKAGWYHNKGDSSPYSKDSSALSRPTSADKQQQQSNHQQQQHKDGRVNVSSGVNSASGQNSVSGNASAKHNDINMSGNDLNNDSNRVGGGGHHPNVTGSNGGYVNENAGVTVEDGKLHLANSYPPYDTLLSFGNPHPAAPYDYYPPAATLPPPHAGWGYPEMAGKTPAPAAYHQQGRVYAQNGRENLYGNGNQIDRTAYPLSPHDKLGLQTALTPPPGSGGGNNVGGGGAGVFHGNSHVPTAHPTKAAKGERGHRGRGGGHHGHHAMHHHHDSKNDYHGKHEDQNATGEKVKKKKRKRCGECFGCQRKDNCGECAPCRNDKSHQICKMRRCEKLIERKPHNSSSASAAAAAAAAAAAQQQQQPQPQLPPQPPTQPNTHVQSSPTGVSEKLQFLGGNAGGTAWW